MELPELKFSHRFGDGMVVTLTLIRRENECPKIVSTKKGFITPEIENEYQVWCKECSETAMLEVFTEGEKNAIAIRNLEKELSFQRAFDPTKIGYTHEQWYEIIENNRAEAEESCRHQVNALIDAGWTMVIPNSIQTETWQYYWRRPPKKKGGTGRKYLSTNQAFNALQKEES